MDLRKLKTILELFEESKVMEMEISEGEDRLRLCKHSAPPNAPSAPPATAAAVAAMLPSADSDAPLPPSSEAAVAEGKRVVSPMVGTFYRSSSPESSPFVRVGQMVEVGQTLCIIEAMKLMNEIPSPAAGRVAHILAENGAAVGYGEPLFVLE